MKLRLRNNSIRFRLTQGEVARLAESGSVEESISFDGSQTLTYALSSSASADTIYAKFNGERIEVTVPASTVRLWASTDQVGRGAEQSTGDGGQLSILIEKDFRCLEPRTGGEDDDTFPHPLECVG